MFEEMKKKLDQVLDLVSQDLNQIKTGRAKPAMVENVLVEAYGGRMPLIELSSVSAPDPHLLVISPWDKSVVSSIEKALSQSDLNLNPVVDGQVIRINIPQLTGERRQEMVKLVHQRIEGGRQMCRTVRNDIKKSVEGQKGQAGISEDDISVQLDEMQTIFDSYLERLDKLGEEKEKELKEV